MDDVIPLPLEHRLAPAADLRRLSGGRILIGGAPLSILRLSEAGAKATSAWFTGGPVGSSVSQQRLARRLIGNGMASLVPPDQSAVTATTDTALIAPTVIIPVKDDEAGLVRTLQALTADVPPSWLDGDPLRLIVVDDGSATPLSHDVFDVLSAAIGAVNAVLLRNDRSRGPGGARQRALTEIGLAGTPTDAVNGVLVAFIDAGVEISAAGLAALVQRLDDPAAVAVAPRITSSKQDDLVGRYETRRSPLDLGPSPSLVGPGRAVPYVPTACLVARVDAITAAGGFDPDLRYGEDVDLIWRLGRLGDVVYTPRVEASHPPRSTLSGLIAQRRGYGSAAAPLADRHGDAVSPARLSGWSVLVTGLAVTGHPIAAVAAAAGTGAALRPKIEPLPAVTAEAALLTARGHWYAGLSLLTALVRTWSPFAVVAAIVVPSQRKRIAAVLGAAFARRLIDGPRTVDAAAIDVAVGAIDDLSYCAGVWQGVCKERSLGALKPLLVSWPGPKRGRPAVPKGTTATPK